MYPTLQTGLRMTRSVADVNLTDKIE